MPVEVLLYLITGAAAGFAAGLLGVGGGLIIVPILYLIFISSGFEQSLVMHLALGTSLATIIITSLSSIRAHHRRGAVLWPIVLMLSPGIAIGAWAGGQFAAQLDTAILKPVFGIFELLVALHLLSRITTAQHHVQIHRLKAFLGGSAIGGISSIVGIGGGTMTVPFLHWHNIVMRNAVATSAACGLPIAVFGTASYINAGWQATLLPDDSLGYVFLPAFLCIVITSSLFAPLGARTAHSVSENTLRTVFGITLLLISLKMILPL